MLTQNLLILGCDFSNSFNEYFYLNFNLKKNYIHVKEKNLDYFYHNFFKVITLTGFFIDTLIRVIWDFGKVITLTE